MQQEPQVLLEKERYLSFKGEYQQSADVGREVIKVLPDDRDGVVYLGYDLLNLHDYNQLLDPHLGIQRPLTERAGHSAPGRLCAQTRRPACSGADGFYRGPQTKS